MTAIIGWIGVDNNGVSSAHIMSDSRISWGTTEVYDYGKKVFAFSNSPDILGYCGDVLYPTQILSQIMALADAGILFEKNSDFAVRSESIFNQIITQFDAYPLPKREDTTIYHICRDGSGINSSFYAYKYYYRKDINEWNREQVPLRPLSDEEKYCNCKEGYAKTFPLIFYDGSGKYSFIKTYFSYIDAVGSTASRYVYQSFCEFLSKTNVVSCGGAPQLAKIIREKNAFLYGCIWKGERYVNGSPITDKLSDYNVIEWYNEQMEICDGNSKKRKDTAMRQPNPKNIKL